jgi:hypothetical protein
MMKIPVENVLAAYPPTRRVGALALGPLKLGGALALAALGLDFSRAKCATEMAPLAAAVLAGLLTPDAAINGDMRSVRRAVRRAERAAGGDLKALAEAVEAVCNDAFATRIKAAVPKDAPVSFTPHGLGWPLRLAEQLCADYAWSFEAALETPLARAWALDACARERHGGKHGDFDYIERVEAEKIRERERRRAHG